MHKPGAVLGCYVVSKNHEVCVWNFDIVEWALVGEAFKLGAQHG